MGGNMVRYQIATFLLIFAICRLALAQEDTTMTITKEGKVGIGLTVPQTKLHVNGSLQLDNGDPGVDRLILRTLGKNDPGRYGILFSNNVVSPFLGEDLGNQIYAFYSVWGAKRENDAVISIHGKAVSNWGNTLRLTHDGTDGIINTDKGDILLDPAEGTGNVGIGTDDPREKLEVQGSFSVDGGGGLGLIRIKQADTLKWTFLTAPWIDGDLRLRNEVKAVDVLTFDLQTSNVGVGTTTPQGKLDVNGTIYQRGNTLHADYVFAPEYQLESIDDHSLFMWSNKHLGAIPKAQVDEEGREIVEVGSHRKGIVEELEKAHIYIDQLHNRITKLESAIEKLTRTNQQ
jgi:hypothetical protein